MVWRQNHKLAFLVSGMRACDFAFYLSIFCLSGKTIKVARPARSSLSMSSTIFSKYSSYDPWITAVLVCSSSCFEFSFCLANVDGKYVCCSKPCLCRSSFWSSDRPARYSND